MYTPLFVLFCVLAYTASLPGLLLACRIQLSEESMELCGTRTRHMSDRPGNGEFI